MNQLTDDIRRGTHIDSIVPWVGDFSGKDSVPAFFDAIFRNVDTELFEPREFIVQSDTIVSLGEYGCRVHYTGKRSRLRFAFIWKFRDAKVCSYEQFHGPELEAAFR